MDLHDQFDLFRSQLACIGTAARALQRDFTAQDFSADLGTSGTDVELQSVLARKSFPNVLPSLRHPPREQEHTENDRGHDQCQLSATHLAIISRTSRLKSTAQIQQTFR